MAQLTDTISKSFIVSGASAQEADASITQLSQALAAGVLRGDEFNSVMEQSPRLSQALSASLGVTTGELRGMAEQGQLTTDIVVKALKEQAAAIDDEFSQMPATVGASVEKLKNEWQIFIGELNETSGASELAVDAINGVADSLGTIGDVASAAGTAVAAAMLLKVVPAMAAATTATGLTTLAMTALGKAIPIAVVAMAMAITQAIDLTSAYKKLKTATTDLADVNQQLAESQQALSDRYAEISQQTGVQVKNMRDLEAALAAGTIRIDEQTASYVSAAEAARLFQQRQTESTTVTRAAAAEAAKMSYTQAELSTAYQTVNEQLQTAIDDNSQLASVMSGEVVTALKQGETGIAALAVALQNAEQQGTLTTDQINDGLSAALKELAATDRSQFGDLIKTAMEKIEAGAESAGVSVEQLQTLLGSLQTADLESAFETLGITSQASLQKTADAAKAAFETIRTSGTASVSDIDAAFMVYAEKAITANDGIVDSELEIQAARLGMTDLLDDLTSKQTKAGNAGKTAGKHIADGAKSAKTATAELADETANSARDVQGLTNDLGAWFRGVRSEMQTLSAEAGVMFDSKMGINSGPILTEMEAIEASMESAREQMGRIALDSLQVFDPTGLNSWKNSVITAKNETILAYGQQKLKFQDYMTALEDGESISQRLINSARNATGSMSLLGAENLNTLRSALASAQSQLDQMSDSATSTLTSLREQLYSLQGDTEAYQESQYLTQKADLQAALEEAQAANNTDAIAAYKDSLKTLEKIRAEQKSQTAADTATTASSTTSSSADTTTASTSASIETVTIELGSRSVEVLASDKDDLLEMIEDAYERGASL
ncbi:tape measure protein [Oceanobacter sp. 4_MG-2023]|nr:tape measure protein [Oceanobacter sp. 4_MG-2023]MDP2548088.1 tape measure protein [Oceanobacter sp. 4_MG-2023]